MTETKCFALTTRGLEHVCAAEMRRLPGVSIEEVSYRRITAIKDGPLDALLTLRTVDDIFLDLGKWTGIVPQRVALESLKLNAASMNWGNYSKEIAKMRHLPEQPGYSITTNFVGKRNYTTTEIKQAVMQGISTRVAWPYHEDEFASDVNLRIFIDHETAFIGLRLAKQSLQVRSYKQRHILGSLKPPVAAAMLLLAGEQTNQVLLDPFCGAGTILIEARFAGYISLGGDKSWDAVLAAKKNLLAANFQTQLHCWDACNLPLTNHSVGRIASNMPWGRQVRVNQDITLLYNQACKEMERVLLPGGKVVLLTSFPELIHFDRLLISQKLEISLYGQNPNILIYTN